MKPKSYNGVDLLRFVCSVFIVAIHVPPFGNSPQFSFANFFVCHYLARIAVPCFFIMSGYFLYRKSFRESFDPAPTGSYLRKMLRLYLIWGIVYFPFKLEIILSSPNGILYSALSCLRDYIFVGTYGHLWYLNASMVGVLMVSFLLNKKVPVSAILSLGFLLYLAGMLFENWAVLIQPLRYGAPGVWRALHLGKKVFVTTRNGIFEGFFFIAVGMAFSRHSLPLKLQTAATGFLASMVLLFAEVFFTTRGGSAKVYDMYLFAAPAGIFLFAAACRIQLKDSAVYPFLRTLSALLFYIHPMVIIVLARLAGRWGVNLSAGCLHFLLTIGISLGLSYTIIRLSRIKKLHRLKLLYC